MRILVACEESATVRDFLRRKGIDAWSCDLLPTRGDPSFHYQADVFSVIESQSWDFVFSHPPCTYIAVSGNRWYAGTQKRQEGLAFAARFLAYPGYVENPISVLSQIRKPDQIIQPWMFGHPETKATCLWLNGLPPLKPTDIVEGREQRVWRMAPGPNRQRDRSKTFDGIAEAMASQWF